MEIRKLNSLRGLAALIVFVTHFSDITHWLEGLFGGSTGQYGVMLFFILSGFLLAYLYAYRPFKKAHIHAYLVARAARVLPLYIAVVMLSYLLSVNNLSGLYAINTVPELLSHLLFMRGASVLWSIPPEIHFYIIFIGLWALVTHRKGYVYALVAATMILLFLTNYPRLYGEINGVSYNAFQSLRSLPFFFVGMVMGMHYASFNVPVYMKKHRYVLTLLLIPMLFPELTPVTSDAVRKMWLSFEVLFVMSCVFFCVVFLVPDNNLLLANPIGDFLGKISFSLYLLHMPIIEVINQFPLAIETKLVAALVASIGVASITFYGFEKPCATALRKAFIKTKKGS